MQQCSAPSCLFLFTQGLFHFERVIRFRIGYIGSSVQNFLHFSGFATLAKFRVERNFMQICETFFGSSLVVGSSVPRSRTDFYRSFVCVFVFPLWKTCTKPQICHHFCPRGEWYRSSFKIASLLSFVHVDEIAQRWPKDSHKTSLSFSFSFSFSFSGLPF